MSADLVAMTINGAPVEANPARPLLEAIRATGVEIPTLCYHPALKAYGACRLCLVEAEWDGRNRMIAACSTPPIEGMSVRTSTEDAERARKLSMQLILARCSGVKSLWEFAARLGVTDTPFEKHDEDCIQCGLCERVCREFVGRSVIAFSGRGAERDVRSPFDKESEVCIGCEACVSVCPTGKVKSVRENGSLVMKTWKTKLEIAPCPECGRPYAPGRMMEYLKARAKKVNMRNISEHMELCPLCRRHIAAANYHHAIRAWESEK